MVLAGRGILISSYIAALSAPPDHTEKSLLQQVSTGNESAFREIFYRYADRLGAYVFRITRSREYTEEIVQDVFLKIWMSREVLAEVENFDVYLYVVSRNQALNALRKIILEREKRKEWEKTAVPVIDITYGIDTASDEDDLTGLIDQAINQLPDQQKRVWVLSRQQRLTHREIARELALSQETVKKYIMYANQSLARFIKSRLK